MYVSEFVCVYVCKQTKYETITAKLKKASKWSERSILKNNYDVINKREKMFHFGMFKSERATKKKTWNSTRCAHTNTPKKALRSSDKNQVTSKTTYMNENVSKQRHLLYLSERHFFFCVDGARTLSLFSFFFVGVDLQKAKCLLTFIWQSFFTFYSFLTIFWLNFFPFKFTHNEASMFLHCLEFCTRFQGANGKIYFIYNIAKHLFAFDPQLYM